MKKDWKAEDCVEWTYERPEGDIVLYARTALEALETIRQHGFIITDPKKLKQTSSVPLSRHLKKEGIS